MNWPIRFRSAARARPRQHRPVDAGRRPGIGATRPDRGPAPPAGRPGC